MDIDHLVAGQRFEDELEKALKTCDVLIAVIGRQWPSILKERSADGARDFVREEIAAALARGVPIVPALVNDAALPAASELPADIRDIVRFQAHTLSHARFGRDVDDLAAAIRKLRGRPGRRPGIPWRSMAALLVLGAIGAGAYLSGMTPADLAAPMAAPPLSEAEAEARLQAMTREAQELLAELGYDPGPADGMRGVQTADAIKAFQKDMGTTGRTVFGQVDESLLGALRVAKRTKLREERQNQRESGAAKEATPNERTAKTSPAAAASEHPAQPPPPAVPSVSRADPNPNPGLQTPALDASGCILLPSGFQPFAVTDGTRICSLDGSHSATVEQIANRAMRFSQSNGPTFTCGAEELCQFAWRGAPPFRVQAQSDPSRGISPSGSLHPR